MVVKHQDWKKLLVPIDSIVQDLIRILNETGLRIVLVVDQNSALIGSVSDGDIRRGLLRGITVGSPTSEVVNFTPLFVKKGTSLEATKEIMVLNKIYQIPIIDEKKRIVGIHLLDEITFPASYDNKIVIMAGGRGSRLMPITSTIPKSMLQVAGKPILELIIQRAKSQGFTQFILAVHYLSNLIENYFGNGSSLGVSIEYLKEDLPLGTAGALSLLKPYPDRPLIVTNGDVLTDINYGEFLEFHTKNKSIGTMAVNIHEWQNPFGAIVTNGIEITGIVEKPIIRNLVNAGVYVLDPSALLLLEENVHTDMTTLFDKLRAKALMTTAYVLHEKWIDIGTHAQLKYATENYRLNEQTNLRD